MTARPVGVLLAGGASSRFGGRHKGLLSFSGRRLADFPLDALTVVCDEVCIAANDPDAASWFPGHRVVRDSVSGLGSIGALHTALTAAAGRVAVVCAWDLPLVTSDILLALVNVVQDGATCCVPRLATGLEPLCAAYDSAACLPAIEQMIRDSDLVAHRVLTVANGHAWSPTTAIERETVQRAFFNVNTPDDLRDAEYTYNHRQV
jgi:molybdenum cofactor guanylyltransferase